MSSFEARYQDRKRRERHDRLLAKQLNLTYYQLQFLKALADGDYHDLYELVSATGIYSNICAALHLDRDFSFVSGSSKTGLLRRENSLAMQRLVKVSHTPVAKAVRWYDRKVLTFQITAKGQKLLQEAGIDTFPLATSPSAFQARFEERRRQTKTAKQQAKKLKLRGYHLTILRALADSDWHDLHEVARATGIHSGLPKWLYKDKGSLTGKGLVKDKAAFLSDDDTIVQVLTFHITPAGQRLLASLQSVKTCG